MSTNQGYQKSAAVAERLDEQLDGMADKPATMSVAAGRPAGAEDATAHPGYYHTTTPAADLRMAYRLRAADPGGAGAIGAGGVPAVPGGGLDDAHVRAMAQTAGSGDYLKGFKVNLTDKDVQWLEERRAEEQQVDFDSWVASHVNISQPGEARWLQEKYPQFWERREKFIDDKINLEAKLAKIALRGIKDVNDMKVLYAIDRGLIKPPTNVQWRPGPAPTYRAGWVRAFGYGKVASRHDTGTWQGAVGQGFLTSR